MPAKKRTKAERELDMAWIVEQAEKGLGPTAILQVAKAEGRRSVAQLSPRMVCYDLRFMRDRALAKGDKVYKKILERTIEELGRLAFADLRGVLEWGPDGITIRDCFELNERDASIVSAVKMKTTTRTLSDGSLETTHEAKLETHSKNQALRDLLHLLSGYLTPTVPVDSADADSVLAKLIDRLSQAEEPDSDEADSGESDT